MLPTVTLRRPQTRSTQHPGRGGGAGIQAEEEEQDIQAEEEQGEEEELGIQAEEEEQDIPELTSLPTISPIKSPPRRQQDKARKRRKRDYEFYEVTPIAVRRPRCQYNRHC